MNPRMLLAVPLTALLVACGGRLEHKVNDATVADLEGDKRAALRPQWATLGVAHDAHADTEKEVKEANRLVAAKEQVVAAKKAALELAEAELAYAEAKRDYAEGRRDAAVENMWVAHARYELAKAKAVGKGPNETKHQYEARIAAFEQQLAEAEVELADAKITAAERKAAMHMAKQEVGDM